MVFTLIIAVVHYQSYTDYVDMEVTAIEDAIEGEQVKIFGVINSSNKFVITGFYEGSGDNKDWVWQTRNFYMEDETRSIWVDTSGLSGEEDFSNIRSGPHDEKQYWSGDNICVIGKVYNSSAKGPTIRSEYIGKDPSDFGPGIIEIIMIGGPVLISTVLAFITAPILYIRMKKHKEHFEDFIPIRQLQAQQERKPGIEKRNWVDSNYRKISRVSLVLGVVFTIILIIIFYYMIRFPDIPNGNDSFFNYSCLSLIIIPLVVLVLVFFLLYALSRNHFKISRLHLKGILMENNITEIENVLKDVLEKMNMAYDKSKRELFRGTLQEVQYYLRDDGIEIKGDLIKERYSFAFNLTLSFQKEVSTSFEEKLKSKIEFALNQYFNMKITKQVQ